MAFCNDFWEGDGFEKLILRLRDGKEALKNFNTYLVERAAIEESYGKQLLKLAIKHTLAEEMPSEKATYESFRSECQVSGETAIEFANACKDLGTRVMQYKDAQKHMRKSNTSDKEKYVKTLDAEFQKVDKLKGKMWSYGKTMDEQHTAFKTAQANKTLARKEIAAAQQKYEKSEKEFLKAFEAYDQAIPKVHEAQAKFVEQMHMLFTDISAVQGQNSLTVQQFAGMFEEVNGRRLASLNGTQPVIHNAVTSINGDTDMVAWTALHRTGSNRPPPYLFAYYESKHADQHIPAAKSMEGIVGAAPPPTSTSAGPSASYASANDDETTDTAAFTPTDAGPSGMSDTATTDDSPKLPRTSSSSGLNTINTSPATVVDPSTLPPPPPAIPPPVEDTGFKTFFVRALFPYEPQYQGELRLQADDTIEVLEVAETGWWRGRVNGEEGHFPANYTDQGVPQPPA